MFKLPKSIMISGYKFHIELVDMDGIEADVDVEQRVIRINKARDPEKYESTLLHEILHAAIGLAGLNNLVKHKIEEAIVSALERTLYPLINIKVRGRRK